MGGRALTRLSITMCLVAAHSLAAQVVLPAAGVIQTIGGNGVAGYSGDNGPATSAELRTPARVAIDGSGNVYISDYSNNRVRKITASTGTITTIGGTGTAGYSGDNGAATAAEIDLPYGIAVDGSGNVYFSDLGNNRVRKISSSGTITTVAGNGTAGYTGDSGVATSAELNQPAGIAVDSVGNIYISDSANHRIRKVAVSGGVITTIVGNGTSGSSGDGSAGTSAEIETVVGIAVDSAGSVYFADHGTSKIRKWTAATTIVSTIAGNGTLGYSGDGGTATSAEIEDPSGLAVDLAGNVYFADTNSERIRKVTFSTGIISTVAGNGSVGFAGDGGVATSAELSNPTDAALDASGNLYIADYSSYRVRVVGAERIKPTISVTASPASVAFGAVSATFTATVPAGAASVTFSNGKGWTSSAVAVSGTTASVAIAGLTWTAGSYTITASYSGNSAYSAASATTAFTVIKAMPAITWKAPTAIAYGVALSSTQLNATSSVPGTFVYSPAAGTVPAAGTDTLSTTFTPTDATDYASVTATVSLVVGKTAPTVSWVAPAAILYGTALSATQLDATASVAGSFSYSPVAGTIPAAGVQTLSTTFTPTNTTDYTTAAASVSLTVNRSTPVITWAAPAAIAYGTALSATQLNATASVAGTFAYSPAAGTVPGGGSQTLSVTFTPTNATDYAVVTKSVAITVNKSASTITVVSSASSAPYATALTLTATVSSGSSGATVTFLNGTATLGTATISGTTASLAVSSLVVGSHSITASWPGNANRTAATSAAITQTITQATPVLTWATPSAILYGTKLSATQLDASAGSVAGTLVYTPAAGTTPAVGTDTLSVTFTPTDAVDYKAATKTVSLGVNQAASTISVASSSLSSVYGTSITFTATLPTGASGNVTFLNGTTSLGAFPISGTTAAVSTATLTAGTHSITASWPGNANLTAATSSAITETVAKATPVVSWTAPAAIVYGTALSTTQLDATASVAGTFVYSPAAGTVPHGGSQTLSTSFTPTDTADYNSPAAKTVTLTVNKAIPVLTWTTPSPIAAGTALSTAQLNATASVAGTFVYSPVAGTKPAAGTDTLSVTFTPTDVTDYGAATKSASLTVLAIPSITLGSTAGLPGSSLRISGSNFGATQSSSTVTFSGVTATVVSWSATTIAVNVPPQLGAGVQQVVVNVDGVAPSPPLLFEVQAQITAISLPSGVSTMGLTITGIGFGNAEGNSTVTVGGVAAAVIAGSWTDTSIAIQIPQIAVGAGPVNAPIVVNVADPSPLAEFPVFDTAPQAFTVSAPFTCD
jgi:hypothetical protein